MLRFLFPRLTPAPERGEALFAALTGKAREHHWYVEGEIPDTIDGRFRMLATVTALAIVRLEQCGEEGEAASVALTERFIEVMEAEHRELGLGDPALGRTVRKLVGALAHRVELWRSAAEDPPKWAAAAQGSLYKDQAEPQAINRVASRLRAYWSGLQGAELGAIVDGQVE